MGHSRKLHKRAGSGERTNALNHLEFRAWVIYRLAADDFGVMRCDIGALIESHPCLAQEKPRKLRAALEKLVNVKLLGRFEAHGLKYVYSRDWQDYEKSEYASVTTLPKVPDEFLEGCSEDTKHLFSIWPGGRLPKPSKPEIVRESCQINREIVAEDIGKFVATKSLLRANPNPNPNSNSGFPEGGSGETATRPQPLHGRRNPDLLTFGPIPLWASQFRDEILPLAATHHGGNRDDAYRPALEWVGELDTLNQKTPPAVQDRTEARRWWSEHATARWASQTAAGGGLDAEFDRREQARKVRAERDKARV